LQANSLRVGNHILAGLKRLKEKYPVIGDVRGRGLMLGIEFVKDRATKEPGKEVCAQVVENARELGLTGWVRNLSDGRVEVLADGDEDALHKLLEALRTGPRLATVEHVEALAAAEEKAVKGFTKRLTVEA
jgi:acylphosphatase